MCLWVGDSFSFYVMAIVYFLFCFLFCLGVDVDADGCEVDDLDISVAVAMTEPDVSQLMEDLEIMAREKAELELGNNAAQAKASSAAESAQAQRDQYLQDQQLMTARLRELEASIAHRESAMSALTEAQAQAAIQAAQQQQRAAQLEQESERLREQLQCLDTAHQQTAEEASEERQRRREYEEKLQAAESQLQEMENERRQLLASERKRIASEEKSQLEAKHAEQHVLELEAFRAEHARLKAQITQAENKQRKTLDQLTHQVAQYKKRATDSQQQIKQLEEKNADLRSRLDRLAKAKRKTSGVMPAAGAGAGAGAGGVQDNEAADNESGAEQSDTDADSHVEENRSINGSSSRRGKASLPSSAPSKSDHGASGQRRGTAALAQRAISSSEIIEILVARVAEICELKAVRGELDRLLKLRRDLKADREETFEELRPILQVKAQREEGLRAKLVDIDKKAMVMRKKAEKLHDKLREFEHRQDRDDSPAVLAVRRDYEDVECSLGSYAEHKREIQSRLDQSGNFLDPDALARLQELQEELETLDTEIELNGARIAHEHLRMGKLTPPTLSSSISSAKEQQVNDSAGVGRLAGDKVADQLKEEQLYDALVRDLQRLLSLTLSTSKSNHSGDKASANNSDPASAAKVSAVLRSLLSMVVDARWQSRGVDGTVQQLQQQLDDKAAEYDEVVRAMQRSRSEAQRRLEQQRKEAEEKIAFLLQQLRSAEAARRTLEAASTSASASIASRAVTPACNGAGMSLRGALSAAPVGISTEGSLRVGTAGSTGSLHSQHSHVSTGTAFRLPSDAALSEAVQRMTRLGGAGGTGVAGGAGGEVLQWDAGAMGREVERRWHAEKERRELLEKRNAEISKELRELRQQMRQTRLQTEQGQQQRQSRQDEAYPQVPPPTQQLPRPPTR